MYLNIPHVNSKVMKRNNYIVLGMKLGFYPSDELSTLGYLTKYYTVKCWGQ